MATDVTRVLCAIEGGDPHAAEELLPLVYDELRTLARQRMQHSRPGQTLQPTALVHEAYLRLVDVEHPQHWNGRGHFFAAAAEAMRRILVERARRKKRLKHGGGRVVLPLDQLEIADQENDDELLAIDEALGQLAATDAQAAELVKLRFFAGFTGKESAEILGMSPRSADFLWAYARTWLLEKMQARPAPSG